MTAERGDLIGGLRTCLVLLLVLAVALPLVWAFGPEALRAAEPKRVAAGIMTRDGTLPADPLFTSAVAAVAWAELEPSNQSFDGPGWSTIDALLANSRKPRLRLRIAAGRDSPSWVKRLGGPPVSAKNLDCSSEGGIAVTLGVNEDQKGCVPYFWETKFLDEYDELMAEVARRYEDHPLVAEVVDTACTTINSEPFIRAGSNAGSNERLWDAGLNETTDLACQDRAMSIHAAAFHSTTTSLSVSPWHVIMDPSLDSSGHEVSWPKARVFVDRWRDSLGARLSLQNNGLGTADGCPAGGGIDDAPPYCYLSAAPAPKGFQTETWSKLGSSASGLYAAIDSALAMGACFVELPRGYQDPDGRLPAYDADLEANCGGAPAPDPSPTDPTGADTEPPTAPTNLRVTGTTRTTVSLTWNASTDNVGVVAYVIVRDGSEVAQATGTSFTDTGLARRTAYFYQVKATDAAGNLSVPSATVKARTKR